MLPATLFKNEVPGNVFLFRNDGNSYVNIKDNSLVKLCCQHPTSNTVEGNTNPVDALSTASLTDSCCSIHVIALTEFTLDGERKEKGYVKQVTTNRCLSYIDKGVFFKSLVNNRVYFVGHIGSEMVEAVICTEAINKIDDGTKLSFMKEFHNYYYLLDLTAGEVSYCSTYRDVIEYLFNIKAFLISCSLQDELNGIGILKKNIAHELLSEIEKEEPEVMDEDDNEEEYDEEYEEGDINNELPLMWALDLGQGLDSIDLDPEDL